MCIYAGNVRAGLYMRREKLLSSHAFSGRPQLVVLCMRYIVHMYLYEVLCTHIPMYLVQEHSSTLYLVQVHVHSTMYKGTCTQYTCRHRGREGGSLLVHVHMYIVLCTRNYVLFVRVHIVQTVAVIKHVCVRAACATRIVYRFWAVYIYVRPW